MWGGEAVGVVYEARGREVAARVSGVFEGRWVEACGGEACAVEGGSRAGEGWRHTSDWRAAGVAVWVWVWGECEVGVRGGSQAATCAWWAARARESSVTDAGVQPSQGSAVSGRRGRLERRGEAEGLRVGGRAIGQPQPRRLLGTGGV